MSASGQKLTSCRDGDQSALGQKQKPDIPHAISVVRQIADILLFYEKDELFTGE